MNLQIDYINEYALDKCNKTRELVDEFEIQFSNRENYTLKDLDLALKLLDHYIEYTFILSDEDKRGLIEYLTANYPGLFLEA